MATQPERPPFARNSQNEGGKERALATILTQRPDIVGERKLTRDTAHEHARKLLAKNTTAKQKQQLKAAWDYRDDCYAKWDRACADFDEAQGNEPEDYGDGKSGDRKRKRDMDKKDELQKAAEDEKESAAFLQKMQDKFDNDREAFVTELEALIENESMRPAIEAIMKHGMCECAGAHGVMCAWVLMTWFAAEAFRAKHGAEASSVLASMSDDAISSYLVDASVEIKVLRRLLDSLIYAQASSLKEIPNLEGDVRAQLDAAASGAWDALRDVSWPPEHKFVEATYRRSIEKNRLCNGPKSWPGSHRAAKLNNRVVTECGMSRDDARKLEESEKINMLVDNQRQKYTTPLEKISEFTETFRAFVAHPVSLDEAVRVVKTIVALAHGDSLLTIGHCALLDARVLLRRREQYLEAEEMGEIGNLENFYSPGNQKQAESQEVGKKLTRTLMKASDLPECLKVDRGRISLIGESDAKLHVDSLLTATAVARCVVLLGAVKDVENTKEAAAGRIVVTCLIEGEPWHVLCNPSHLAMMNPFTPNCLLALARIFLPTLSLGYQQSTSFAPPLKMVESGDGGVVVGNSGDKTIKAEVKSAFPKTIRQMDN